MTVEGFASFSGVSSDHPDVDGVLYRPTIFVADGPVAVVIEIFRGTTPKASIARVDNDQDS